MYWKSKILRNDDAYQYGVTKVKCRTKKYVNASSESLMIYRIRENIFILTLKSKISYLIYYLHANEYVKKYRWSLLRVIPLRLLIHFEDKYLFISKFCSTSTHIEGIY